MNEKVLGIIRLMRHAFPRRIWEFLFITPDRVIVARATSGVHWALEGSGISAAISMHNLKKAVKKYLESPLDDVLKADKNNYAIPNSEIIEVELKNFGRGSKYHTPLKITTNKKTHKWRAAGLIPELEDPENILYKLEDYENILQLAFPDKLSVKK